MRAKILLVMQDFASRAALAEVIAQHFGFAAVQAAGSHAALKLMTDPQPSGVRLVIMDPQMPDADGMEILAGFRKKHSHIPVILINNGKLDISRAMKAGAFDVIDMPPNEERLQQVINNALKLSLLEKEYSRLIRQETGIFTFENVVGHDAGLVEAIKIGRKAATTDAPLLLTGETGVGKEVFARAVHGESNRAGKPFVAVNCGALPEQLVESTLFGHVTGSFTGAIANAIGKFREAHGGTLFLDEIGELPLPAQVKILRAIQSSEISPVGDERSVSVDVRIVAATNRDLEKAMKDGRFRDDLYFRLNVLQVHLPSLAERRKDIPALAYHFIERLAASERRPMKDISFEAITALMNWDWPGNVRELENTIHRAMILSENKTLAVDDFDFAAHAHAHGGEGQEAPVQPPVMQGAGQLSLLDAQGRLRPLAEIEKMVLAFSLQHHQHNVTHAADALGMAKSTFYRKMKEMGEK